MIGIACIGIIILTFVSMVVARNLKGHEACSPPDDTK